MGGPSMQRIAEGELPPATPMLTAVCYSQSLERGLAILETFTPEEPVLGIAELAERLGVSRSTTHRYVLTLTALGYLKRPRAASTPSASA